MIRKLAALVIGVGMALVIIMISEAIGHQIFPLTEESVPGIDLPTASLLPVVAGWVLGTLGGGYAAVRLGRDGWEAWAVAAAIVVSVIIGYAIAEPGTFPLWMLICGIALPLLTAWLVRRVAAPNA